MTIPAGHVVSRALLSLAPARKHRDYTRREIAPAALIILFAAALLLSTLVFAQTTPKITGVDPPSGKVNDTLTVSGVALGKESVAAIFLSDEKSDYKAAIVSQAADKIVMKVPQVKPGGYNVSIQVGGGILIEPVRFTVEQ
jgi:IPT/TIG domain-containing protein